MCTDLMSVVIWFKQRALPRYVGPESEAGREEDRVVCKDFKDYFKKLPKEIQTLIVRHHVDKDLIQAKKSQETCRFMREAVISALEVNMNALPKPEVQNVSNVISAEYENHEYYEAERVKKQRDFNGNIPDFFWMWFVAKFHLTKDDFPMEYWKEFVVRSNWFEKLRPIRENEYDYGFEKWPSMRLQICKDDAEHGVIFADCQIQSYTPDPDKALEGDEIMKTFSLGYVYRDWYKTGVLQDGFLESNTPYRYHPDGQVGGPHMEVFEWDRDEMSLSLLEEKYLNENNQLHRDPKEGPAIQTYFSHHDERYAKSKFGFKQKIYMTDGELVTQGVVVESITSNQPHELMVIEYPKTGFKITVYNIDEKNKILLRKAEGLHEEGYQMSDLRGQFLEINMFVKLQSHFPPTPEGEDPDEDVRRLMVSLRNRIRSCRNIELVDLTQA